MSKAQDDDEQTICFIEATLEGISDDASALRHYASGKSAAFREKMAGDFSTLGAVRLMLVHQATCQINNSKVARYIADYVPSLGSLDFYNKDFGQQDINRLYHQMLDGEFAESYQIYEAA